ncbi:MAG: Rne/Rng family ribonuclease [Phycisphaeraceae bacterium]|nr:Rne/Rng family ribonuclease [Phycisphaeraceae bacterium]MBX3405443.1 Rne/Rng family ribonuclease [Phycisphaeraceae bacterium]
MSKQMVINYVPGEECRVAVLENDRLEEFHAERMDSASHVGNIYIGKVVNVEQGIQAAFVDFGLPANGFLHVTDLHPRYFPGEDQETTERVGKKTPRRERPPIQACLRRGQEIAVQVIKEGVGTKGPTVTSYLSVPGRFLVMMPQMDRVGVSRKVEDEETRRKMREILDQLDLPDGFGFILRTAGMDRTKAELKRDLAYLSRLWKDMEKRWQQGNKPRLLYSESDLLVRTLRDTLTTDMDRVVIDNDAALNRAARFLKIVAPRTATKLVHYTGKAPIFHVMGVEQQIQNIHAREVPLPGGGRLVFDEAEALVAIDVNSGKMRDAKDAETTAYRTNVEATDEICRQLRLRDVGGVIVNDLIDMRQAKHRREIENRFKENLKRDRARWTIAPISEFGILEMTRQRMRGSHESQHFADCPVCRGRGLVQRPESVAADALRELGAILENDKIARAEMVVSPRIAGELLSSKRRALARIERTLAKHVDVRISDAIPVDRVNFYAYDAQGNDLDVARLKHRTVRSEELVEHVLATDTDPNWAEIEDQAPEVVEDVVEEVVELPLHPIEMDEAQAAAAEAAASQQEVADGKGRRGRRGRGGRGGRGGGAPLLPPMPAPKPAAKPEAQPADGQPESEGEGGSRKRRRRRRGRGGRGEVAPQADGQSPTLGDTPVESSVIEASPAPADGAALDNPVGTDEPGAPETGERKRRRRRRRGRGGRGGGGQGAPAEGGAPSLNGTHPPAPAHEGDSGGHDDDVAGDEPEGAAQPADGPAGAEGGGGRRKRRRRRRGRGGGGGGAPQSDSGPAAGSPSRPQAAPQPAASAPKPPASTPAAKPRTLYVSRRRLLPSERKGLTGGGDE